MNFTINKENFNYDGLALFVNEDLNIEDAKIAEILQKENFKGEFGKTTVLSYINDVKRIFIVGAGKKEDLSQYRYQQCLNKVAKFFANENIESINIDLPQHQDKYWAINTTVAEIFDANYKFDVFKKQEASKLANINLNLANANQQDLNIALATIKGQKLTRDLANSPANYCTPSHIAEKCQELVNDKITCQIFDEKQLAEMGCNSFLSVSKGSQEPAKMIVLEYKGADKNEKPYVLVGKGITFDSGGISIKPSPAMDEMKFDMCGAAGVLGSFVACAELNLPINLVTVLVCAENLPSGNATKPGDIVKSMSGQTIEILNTDAEGRLVLCDALTYVEKYQPKSVINVATLTGAIIVALGQEITGLMGNSSKLANDLKLAAEQTNDHVHELPLPESYQKLLDSPFADIANIGAPKGGAGSITAGCFLSRFTKKYPWVHLDIAGTGWNKGSKNATGRPVALLVKYLTNKAYAEKS